MQKKELSEAKKNSILKKIDRFKKALRSEKAKFGGHHDGGGYRYEIAELYFKLGDYKKTNRYLNWFDKNFPDDSTYPHFKLGAAVTKFELGKLQEAKRATISLNEDNTYVIDLLVSNDISDQKKYEWGHFEALEWAEKQFPNLLILTTPDYLDWLKNFKNENFYQKFYNKYIAIKRLLKDLDGSEERNSLLDAQYQCIKDWKAAI